MKKSMKRILSLSLVLVFVVALSGISYADVSKEYHWTAAMTVSETTINYMIVDKFAELLNERWQGYC